MLDTAIIDLYWSRSEDAIAETEKKYGRYCRTIAWNILRDWQDCEECVSDTYFNAWKAMPPQRPNRLAVFLGKITRNLALDRYKANTARKRGSGQVALALEELRDCLPAPVPTEQIVDDITLTETLKRFLADLKPEARRVFLRRYWYASSIGEIARDYGWTESRVKMSLLRSREKLKARLEEEGITL